MPTEQAIEFREEGKQNNHLLNPSPRGTRVPLSLFQSCCFRLRSAASRGVGLESLSSVLLSLLLG